MSGWLIAIISGALMSIQGVFNTEVTKTSGIWVSGGWVQLTAFFTCLAAWLFTGREHIRPLLEVEPKYMLLGGVMGAFITFTVIGSCESRDDYRGGTASGGVSDRGVRCVRRGKNSF